LDRPPLLAPLLEPSMTRMADENKVRSPDICVAECAQCYRAYLPNASQRLQVNGLQRVHHERCGEGHFRSNGESVAGQRRFIRRAL